jgi:hypothetical protein
MKLLVLIFFIIPVIVEVISDAHGDYNKKIDVLFRMIFIVGISLIIHFLGYANFFAAVNVGVAIHFLLFDYVVTSVLIKNKVIEVSGAHWFSYMGRSSKVDNISFWRNIKPWGRFAIRLGYFIGSLVLYFKV